MVVLLQPELRRELRGDPGRLLGGALDPEGAGVGLQVEQLTVRPVEGGAHGRWLRIVLRFAMGVCGGLALLRAGLDHGAGVGIHSQSKPIDAGARERAEALAKPGAKWARDLDAARTERGFNGRKRSAGRGDRTDLG